MVKSGKATGRLGPRTQGWDRMPDKYSVTLATVTEEDYLPLSQWASSNTGVYASGTKNHVSAAEFKAFLDRSDDEFLMVCTLDGQAIGAVSWKPGHTVGSYIVGTMIGDSDMWGAGFGLEATMLLVGTLFDLKGAHRVEFICGVFNRGSVENFCSGLIAVEGILRDYYF